MAGHDTGQRGSIHSAGAGILHASRRQREDGVGTIFDLC